MSESHPVPGAGRADASAPGPFTTSQIPASEGSGPLCQLPGPSNQDFLPVPGGSGRFIPGPPSPRLRFALVELRGAGGRQRHSLPPEVSDAEATLCEPPRPGRWDFAGFTCRLAVIGCPACSARAAALRKDRTA